MNDEKFEKEKVLECAREILKNVESLDSYRKNNKGRFENLKDSSKFLDVKNGIYFFYDNSLKKIVRIGTHTADDRLKTRIAQHLNKGYNASVFRKRVGLAIKGVTIENLSEKKEEDKLKSIWDENLDKEVTDYIQNLEIKVINVEIKKKRLEYENKLIATLSWAGFFADEFRKTDDVMKKSPDSMIRNFGLWLKDGMFDEPVQDVERIEEIFS